MQDTMYKGVISFEVGIPVDMIQDQGSVDSVLMWQKINEWVVDEALGQLQTFVAHLRSLKDQL